MNFENQPNDGNYKTYWRTSNLASTNNYILFPDKLKIKTIFILAGPRSNKEVQGELHVTMVNSERNTSTKECASAIYDSGFFECTDVN